MGALFLFGTIWFWLLISFTWIVITITTEHEEPTIWGTVVFAGTLVLLYFGGNSEEFKSAFVYIQQNPGKIILYFFIYLILGTIWSFVKWYFFLVEKRDYYKNNNFTIHIDHYTASDNKGMIINWMIYWPLSSFWTLINHPVKRAFKFIFKRFEKQYENMANRILKDIKKTN